MEKQMIQMVIMMDQRSNKEQHQKYLYFKYMEKQIT